MIKYATSKQLIQGLYEILPRDLIIMHLTGAYFKKISGVSFKSNVTHRTMNSAYSINSRKVWIGYGKSRNHQNKV